MLARRGERLLARVFTDAERAASPSVAQLGERFAAKEAAMKALGFGWAREIEWRDVEVVAGPVPSLALHGTFARLAAEAGVTRAQVSLSHTATNATALVILSGDR
jgi:holo-[acyl-carrier protein] synthase